jgi:transposase-like protein
MSGHSIAKIYRIIYRWLKQKPPALLQNMYSGAKYLLFDGTYFHKDGCLIVLMDVVKRGLIDYAYIEREDYHDVHARMMNLKEQGLSPVVVTLDGHKPVTKAFLHVWPGIITQRCLFHVENQGLMWIRSFPRTLAGKELRILLKGLTKIASQQDQDQFQQAYSFWRERHIETIRLLPKESVANKDLQRTMKLIDNALPNMFWFIKDPKIAKTTNVLEGFYSQLKHHYQRHRGLTTEHKIGYLSWYCYFKSIKNSNTS